MSIPLPGTYRIRSVKFPNQLFDLQGGNVKAHTPVIGYANNSDSKNMLWTVQVVNAADKIVRLINVASGTFAQSGSPMEMGAPVVGSPYVAQLKIIPRNDLGEYSIQPTNGHFACSLAKADNYTHVTLQPLNNNDAKQGWIFCPV
ncbi:hypothetical protein M405DRAFT_909552 [Rhizopogon salebrosus TDB-379]|nr:hypothetical protein M405DRAFT_909552 [Rhizopogon salebrosus TDB-379]